MARPSREQTRRFLALATLPASPAEVIQVMAPQTTTDDPLDHRGDHGASIDDIFATVWRGAGKYGAIFGKVSTEGNANGVQDDVGGHDNGEADESLGEGLFAGGKLAGFAGSEDIEIAAVDNIGEDGVSGDDSKISGNVGGDGPDRFGKTGSRVDRVEVDVTIPGDQAED